MGDTMFATFKKGGVHPADNKAYSSGSAIRRLPVPAELTVSMSQHLGAPATLLKKAGDTVQRGELIGEASGFISANVHSPVSGTIKEVRKTVLATGITADAVVIIPDEVQPEYPDIHNDWRSQSASDLLAVVKQSGIVGLGGATFPTNVKYMVPEGKKVDALVINGVECEPYLTADYRLMTEYPDQVLEGVMIIAKILSPERIIIGIEENKMDVVHLLSDRIARAGLPITVMPLKMKYPQGDEKQLLKATINREIPSGKLPLDVGAVVSNVGTTWAVYKAVVLGQPLTERIVTVTGDCIANPSNFIAPIGTKISYLIEAAGGYSQEPDKLISGGPMMGFAFWDEDTPMVKSTGGILAIKDTLSYEKTPCLHCGKCVAACPIGLEPTKLYSLITHGKYEDAMANSLMDCKECGCCSFSCPAHLDLVQAMKTGKRMGRKK